MKPANRDLVDQQQRLTKKIDQLKAILALQTKISDFMNSPIKFKNPKDSFGEPVDPKYYELVQFYFERIPALKPYKPVEDKWFVKEKSKFYKLQIDAAHIISDLKEWTFLPYSDHKSLGVMSKDLRIALDAVNPQKARERELEVKKRFIKAKVLEIDDEHRNILMPHYREEVGLFITNHSNEIIEKRTKLMIDSKPAVLNIILDYMKSLNDQDKPLGKFSHTDYLPFAEVVPAIVDSMENHPIKPKLTFVGLPKE